MTNTVLGLLRHGQTDWNIDLRLQGTADIPMNAFGIQQIERAAAKLTEFEWDVILSSPLSRARQSAEIVAGVLGIKEVAIETRLLERSFGVGEGLTYREWGEKYSKLDEIPGAESTADVIRRSKELLEHVTNEFAGVRVLAVSHGALIRFVLSDVTQGEIPPPGERLQNASLHTLRHLDGWKLDRWAPEPLGGEPLH